MNNKLWKNYLRIIVINRTMEIITNLIII